MFGNIKSDDSIANEKDSLGGSLLDSGLYPATIKLAYGTRAESGATGLVVHFHTSEGREIRQTFWMTSGTAKGGKNYYEKDGQKHYLQGYLLAQSLSLLANGQEVSDLVCEEKVVKVYNRDTKTEVPTKVQMAVDLIDKPILIGLIKQTVDKTAKDGNGVYQPTGETREENEVDKFFRASDRKTTAEIRAQADATFADNWIKKWAGQVKNKASGAKGAGVAGAPKTGAAAAAGAGKPKASMFA